MILKNPKSQNTEDKKIRVVELTHPEGFEFDFLNPNYEFWGGDEFCKAKSLLEKITQINALTTKIEVKGTQLVLKRYLRLIRRKCKSNGFNFQEIKQNGYNEKSTFSQRILDEELIEKIKNKLPKQPWEKGIHKLIAKELNISNKLCSIGIQQLIANGDYKMQIRGKIIE